MSAAPSAVAPPVGPPGIGHAVVTARRRVVLRDAGRAPAQPRSVYSAVMVRSQEWVVLAGSPLAQPARATIERTTDAGASWRRTFSLPGARLVWIGRDGTGLVAAGALYRGGAALRPLLLRSSDGGASWRVEHPRAPITIWLSETTFAFSGDGAAIAVPATSYWQPLRGVLHSTDDGRDWRIAPLAGGAVAAGGATWAPDGRTAYVAGNWRTGHSSCGSALWRSRDGGRRWRLLQGTCGLGRGLTSGVVGVAFPTARTGFVAGGGDPKFASGQVVFGTRDGGRHWRRLWSNTAQYGEPGIAELVFPDARHGWAIPGGITPGANVPYLGDVLATSDGGHHWRDTGQPGSVLSALPGGRALAAAAVPELSAFALTRDAGRSWTQLTAPEDLLTRGLLAGGDTVTDVTAGGAFVSGDGGRSWRALIPAMLGVHSRLVASRPGLLAALDTSGDRCALRLSRNAGRTYRAVAPPGGTLRRIAVGTPGGGAEIYCHVTSEFAFGDGDHGIAAGQGRSLFLTGDGAVRWHRRAVPFDTGGAALAGSGEVYVAVLASGYGGGSPPGSTIAISNNDGWTWSLQRLSSREQCPGAAVWGHEIWVVCGNLIYRSRDAGATWVALETRDAFVPVSIVAVGAGRAIALRGGAPSAGPAVGSALWETRDGGLTWTHYWPALPIGPHSRPARAWIGTGS